MKTGIEYIIEERRKQINKYGYDKNHDLGYQKNELLFGALSYIKTALYGSSMGLESWPFEEKYFHDEGYLEDLKKAGAFISAEIDRYCYNQYLEEAKNKINDK